MVVPIFRRAPGRSGYGGMILMMAKGIAFDAAYPAPPACRRCRTVAVVGALVLLLAALVGCGGNQGGDGIGGNGVGHGDGDALFPKLPKVVGHIDLVEADPDNPRYFRRLEITDDGGRRWAFGADGWAGVSAAHLKDHRIQGDAVTVWYEERRDGRLFARFVSD